MAKTVKVDQDTVQLSILNDGNRRMLNFPNPTECCHRKPRALANGIGNVGMYPHQWARITVYSALNPNGKGTAVQGVDGSQCSKVYL